MMIEKEEEEKEKEVKQKIPQLFYWRPEPLPGDVLGSLNLPGQLPVVAAVPSASGLSYLEEALLLIHCSQVATLYY